MYQKNISQIYINLEAPQFEQIMTNLLTNAAKFYLQNTNVTITCFDLGDNLEIKVND
jgi:signal transduction histidine kinase